MNMGQARKRTLVRCKSCGKEWLKLNYTIEQWSGLCLRCSLTGENNPFYGKKHTEEARRKMSEALTGPLHPHFGKKKSLETRIKMSNSMRGKKHRKATEEERRRMSESRRGLLVGDKNPMYGKHLSEEHKKRISESNIKYWRGRPKSEAHKRNLSVAIRSLWQNPDYQKIPGLQR